jgi:hypothetical protein
MFFTHAVLAFSLRTPRLQAEHTEPPNFLLTFFLETEEFASLAVPILFYTIWGLLDIANVPVAR